MTSKDKLKTFADMVAYFGTDYGGDFVDVSGKPRYPKAAQDFYRANIKKYKDWLDEYKKFQSGPMYKLHLMVKDAFRQYSGFH